MPIDALYIDSLPGEIRIAGVQQGELREIEIVRVGRESIVGNVYLGKVEKVVAGIRAAFVDIGRERSGFLPLGEAGETLSLSDGAAVIVQVRKDAIDDKGPLLSARPGIAGRFLVYTPFRTEVILSHRLKDHPEAPRLVELASSLVAGGGGFVVRTSAGGALPADLAGDAQTVRGHWEAIQQRAKGSHPPACLHADPSAVHRILRDAAEGPLRRIVFDDAETMRAAESFLSQTVPTLIPMLSLHRGPEPLFESAGLEEQIERALLAQVTLPSGGSLFIEPTKALIAIDVNSAAAARAGGAGLNLATNLEAAGRIAREVRLRNFAGQFAIDFLPLRDRRAAADVVARLKEEFADDPTPAQVFGFTRLGLVEMTRERRRPSLVEQLGEPCPACGGAAFMPSPLTVAFEALRKIPATARAEPGKALILRAAPSVVAALGGEGRAALAEVERRLGRPLMLREEALFSQGKYEIEVASARQERAHG